MLNSSHLYLEIDVKLGCGYVSFPLNYLHGVFCHEITSETFIKSSLLDMSF